ncbi:hypothetical protein B0H13DRAFT_2337272 [Mycena leptocephala]|nr:hypothetical protein B0H13DRAFT_2337272 [Mycena leptocephala]
MSSVQLPPTLHLCIRLNAKHQPFVHSVSRGFSSLLLSSILQCAAEPQTPELATYNMARPPPFPCCDGYGLSLGIVGFWCVISIILLLLRPSSNTTASRSVNFSAYRPQTLTAIRTTADRTGPPALPLLPARDIGRSSIPHIRIASAPPSEIATILSARTAGVDARSPDLLRRVPRRPIRRPRSPQHHPRRLYHQLLTTEDTQITEAPISALLVVVPEPFPFHACRNIPAILSPDAFLNAFLRPCVVVVSSPVPRPFRAHIAFTFTAGRAQHFVAAHAATVPDVLLNLKRPSAPYTGVDPLAHAHPAMHVAQRRDRGYWCVVYYHLVPFHERSLIFAHSFPSFSSPRACIDHPPKQDEQAALAPFTIWPMCTMRGISPHRTTPVCTFCLRTTLRSSFPRVPSRIGHLHINPASPTQFWMRAPLSSTPILPVLPTLFRPRLEFFLSVPPYTPSSRTTNNTHYPAANCSACLRAPCFSLGSRLPRTLTRRLRTTFSVPGTRFSIPCRHRFYAAARTDVAPWEMTLALARFPFRYHPRTHLVSIFLSISILLYDSLRFIPAHSPSPFRHVLEATPAHTARIQTISTLSFGRNAKSVG